MALGPYSTYLPTAVSHLLRLPDDHCTSLCEYCRVVDYVILTMQSYAFFLPTIVRSLGYTSMKAQLLTAPPNLLGYICVLIFTRLSDKVSMRAPFMIAGGLLVAVGYTMLLASDVPRVKYGATFVIGAGLYPCSPLVRTISCQSRCSFTYTCRHLHG